MTGARATLAKWALLTLASGVTGFAGMLCMSLASTGISPDLAGTAATAGTFALVMAAIGALVVVGPLGTLWSARDIFLNGANDANFLVFMFCLPSTLALMVLASVTYLSVKRGRPLPVWPLTLVLSPLANGAFMVVGILSEGP